MTYEVRFDDGELWGIVGRSRASVALSAQELHPNAKIINISLEGEWTNP